MKTDKVVAIEIDGILTAGRSVQSTRHYSPLRDGALEFVAALLAAGYSVVIFTQRVNTTIFRDNLSELRRRVLDWASQVRFPQPVNVDVAPGLPACGVLIAPQCLALPGLDRLDEAPRDVFKDWLARIAGAAAAETAETAETETETETGEEGEDDEHR